MTTLLVHVQDCTEVATSQTVFGGRPSAPQGVMEWPVCLSCEGHMQFLGQLAQGESNELLLLFMCQNEPGMCDEWDAEGGGNQVLAVSSSNLQLVSPPSSGEVVRPVRYEAHTVEQIEEDYESARAAYSAGNGVSPRKVLGQVGGKPTWMQGEEVPLCSACAEPMAFVAQLEQGPDWKTEMNFGGGGCAYVFRCACGTVSPKLLWQC
ncbi:hypothetical protein [Comamonas terrigena]|uniref:hypothetical protein n=1 Tax=Comamonas terrigena TaxID=32013 RepID=UPI00244C9CA0|nr:hypothetical protein [Comamonas terrigena]MDH1701855.1 hypothetical protein [Comamonas terrigena]